MIMRQRRDPAAGGSAAGVGRSRSSALAPVVRLQRTLGNRAVGILLPRRPREADTLQRFADTDHAVIDEVASTLAGLKPEQIKEIHAGNTARDYSQLPPGLNLVLMCTPTTYGGYQAEEHFDNFAWSKELQTWQSRKSPTGQKTPISYIREELVRFVHELPEPAAFRHVGDAFHTIEDFFAHSNFVELTHGDRRYGEALITGSVDGPDSVSILKVLESISNEETAPLYHQQSAREIAQAPPTSHARMAKDYRSNAYHWEAMVLAGLVIRQVAGYIKDLAGQPSREERTRYVEDVIMATVARYLRPPAPDDRWWEELQAAGGKGMESELRETAARTPVTTNQCVLSPLRSLEASRDSNVKMLGLAIPVATSKGHVWVQLGVGALAPPAAPGPTGEPQTRSLQLLPFALQVTKRF
jgi:Heterokaryon incompatibility protein Het-C